MALEDYCPECLEYVDSAFAGGVVGGLLAIGITFFVFLVIALYVYTSLAWYTIAKKLKNKNPWLAWIPFANLAMILQLGGFHWAWVFLILVPILGWIALAVLLIISVWRVLEKRKYPGWFSLAIILPKAIGAILQLIILYFVAWKDRKKKLWS